MTLIGLFLWSTEVDPPERGRVNGGPGVFNWTKPPRAGHIDAGRDPVRGSLRTGSPLQLLTAEALGPDTGTDREHGGMNV